MKLTQLLLFLIIITIPLGQFSRLPINIGEDAAVYLNDLLLPVLIFSWVLWVTLIRKEIRLPPLSLPLFIFLSIAFISLINGKRWLNFNEFIVSSLYFVRFIEYLFLYIITFDLFNYWKKNLLRRSNNTFFAQKSFLRKVNDEISRRFLNWLNLLIGTGVILAILGYFQYIFFPDFSRYAKHGWDPHYYRVLSTFFDPNFTGAFFVLSLSLSLCLFLFVKHSKLKSLFYLLGSMIVFGALLLTFSRSSYVAFVVAVFLVGLLKSRKLLLVGILTALLAFLFIPRVRERIAGIRPGELDASASWRLVSWRNAWEIIKDNPILGVGFNSFRYAQNRYGFFSYEQEGGGHAGAGSDSTFLLIWATTGIFGLLFYLWFYGLVLWKSFKAFLEFKGLTQALGLAVFSGISALIVHSQFVNSLLYIWILEWQWIVWGIFMGLVGRESADSAL